jgi:EAL domain-containing protein (putative c-di-GMP-specific phosphodiesterase class I)
MWNYNLIFPETVILLTFLIFYFCQPKIPVRLNKAFFFIFIIDFATIIFDVICSVFLEHFNDVPVCVLRIQNVIYFILFLQRIICFFMFTTIIIKKDLRSSFKEKFINILPFEIINVFVVLNLFCDTIFRISDEGVYSQGPLYFLIYVCAFYYLFLSIVYILRNRKRLSTTALTACLAYNIILLAGYVLRIALPTYLIMNFFTLISIIIIYLSFQNPSLLKEERTGTFNLKALQLLFSEMKPEKYPVILGFAIHNYNDLREIYSNNQTDAGLLLIGNYLKQNFPHMLIFYLTSGRFVLMGKDISSIEDIRQKIETRFKAPWNAGKAVDMYLDVSFTQIKPEAFFCNRDLVLTTLLSNLIEAGNQEHANIEITVDQVKKIETKKEIKRAVELAVEQNTVELFLQPVFDAKTQKLQGAEALARIRNGMGEIIPPGDFIPIAEKNGRINILGEQMFEKTCAFIQTHDIAAMGLSWINVNLSPIQLLRHDLCSRFTEILKKYDTPAEKIHLEITEESMIDYDLLYRQMELMKKAGFLFVLDDYGRGYSNVARMRRCPFINIKLDMEFVWDYFNSKDKLLPTITQTIKEMGFTVTAEGIENQEMAAEMKKIGCDFLQGYCFSQPIPAEKFVEKYGVKN